MHHIFGSSKPINELFVIADLGLTCGGSLDRTKSLIRIASELGVDAVKDGGADSSFSMEPREFLELKRDVKETWQALGSGAIERVEIERTSTIFRRSLYFVKDLPAGHVLSRSDFKSVRPGFGLAPKYAGNIEGRVLKCDVEFGSPVLSEVLL